MKIGMRTIKTALAASLAYVISSHLGLHYATSASIIAILSVSSTRRSSLETGVLRLLSVLLAMSVAFVCYEILGYNALALGIYILIFIPLAVRCKMGDSIAVSTVIVTHFLLEQTFTWTLVVNGVLLMTIGVGLALLMNSYMPRQTDQIKGNQNELEDTFRHILREMMAYLGGQKEKDETWRYLQKGKEILEEGMRLASVHADNQLLNKDIYYVQYYDMRLMQLQVLKEMSQLLHVLKVDPQQTAAISKLLAYTSVTLSEGNDGVALSEASMKVYEHYRTIPLPASRDEFENRAMLFHLLLDFKNFVEIKKEFAKARFK